MSKLAILGGKKVRETAFPIYNSIGQAEKDAVNRVMDSGVLSKFLGCWDPDFFGGSEIQAFEKEWGNRFQAKHAISVNSNSSGIHAALGACGIGLGDEVIVSPYSMAVSASAPLVWNATPVFADIDPISGSMDPRSIEKKINANTKAILVVHIFGCPADMDEILAIAKRHDLFVIEDCAQAPGATYKGKQVGTLGDMGIFSLNYHKHIHTGEGGVITTNDDSLANKMQLIRNHAEAVVGEKGETDLVNMIGFNFRLTELQAAIGRAQLHKLDAEVKLRQTYAAKFNQALGELPFVTIHQPKDRTHAYYNQSFLFDAGKAGTTRDRYLEAVRAELPPVATREDEGVPINGGYVRPIYLLPMFQKKIAYKDGFPFNKDVNYSKGICPNCEDLHYNRLWLHDFTRSPLTERDVEDVVHAYLKVGENIKELKI